MTLLITVITKDRIFQSSDFRLINPETGSIVTDISAKIVTIGESEWFGIVSYTGVGSKGTKSTSEYLVDWLTDERLSSPQHAAEIIKKQADSWLPRKPGSLDKYGHTFVLSTYYERKFSCTFISNFEHLHKQRSLDIQSKFEISCKSGTNRPKAFMAGKSSRSNRIKRRAIEQKARALRKFPGAVRRELVSENARVSRVDDSVSEECAVFSFEAGGGQCDIDGPYDIKSIQFGKPTPNALDLAAELGIENPRIQGIAFTDTAYSRKLERCHPQVIMPKETNAYCLVEIGIHRFWPCKAFRVNGHNVAVGNGVPAGKRQSEKIWILDNQGELIETSISGQPYFINDREVIAIESVTNESKSMAGLIRDGAVEHLGSMYKGSSGARAVSDSGVVVGWVSRSKTESGQLFHRPALWNPNHLDFEPFDWDWGHAVDINSDGCILVRGFKGRKPCSAIWKFEDCEVRFVKSYEGLIPTALSDNGVLLGHYNNQDHVCVTVVIFDALNGKNIRRVENFVPTAINQAGDISGYRKINGFERPLIYKGNGDMLELPYFKYHHCRPWYINRNGTAVGWAAADHGTHALMWSPAQ